MFPKDLENYELRLKSLREQSQESYEIAERQVTDKYEETLREIFPRDVLGAKRMILWLSILEYGESLVSEKSIHMSDIFHTNVFKTLHTLPLPTQKQQELAKAIFSYQDFQDSREKYIQDRWELSREPLYVLIEELARDGDISHEEFLLFQQEYEKKWNIIQAWEILPDRLRKLFHLHISLAIERNKEEKIELFHSEYHEEIQSQTDSGKDVEAFVSFVSQFYYKTPGKYKKYEHPKQRLRRTMKLALLQLLRLRLGSVEAEKFRERFEKGETFSDYFDILWELLDILQEHPDTKEIYTILDNENEIQQRVHEAEEIKNKILEGESVVMSIAKMLWYLEQHQWEWDTHEKMLEKLLDTSTQLVWEELHFHSEDDKAWIYAEQSLLEDNEEDEEEEIEYTSPQIAYEILMRDFHAIESQKKQAFLQGDYDDIDVYNEKLLQIEQKWEKLLKIIAPDRDEYLFEEKGSSTSPESYQTPF